MSILWVLNNNGVMRYNELKKSIPHITHKMLTSQLRKLEEGFILRKVYPVVLPKVEYTLSKREEKAIKIVNIICAYGIELMNEFGVAHQFAETIKET